GCPRRRWCAWSSMAPGRGKPSASPWARASARWSRAPRAACGCSRTARTDGCSSWSPRAADARIRRGARTRATPVHHAFTRIGHARRCRRREQVLTPASADRDRALERAIAELERQMGALQLMHRDLFAYANAWAERHDAVMRLAPPHLHESTHARLRRIAIRW